MLLGITGFEVRYQLRNPVFSVAVAFFFLLSVLMTATKDFSTGLPAGIHRNAPYAISMSVGLQALFYLFVITAFVANAIVRDDATGFAPIIRATSVTPRQIVVGRFLGAFLVACCGYLSVPFGILIGSVMPWVDPATVGATQVAFYTSSFLLFGLPNLLLLSAVLFAVTTMFRSMMATYLAALFFVIVYLIAVGALGQKIEYRWAFARFEPLGVAALRDLARYWTKSELNDRLIELSGALLANRLMVILVSITLIFITARRFEFRERAPSRFKRLLEARRAKTAAKRALLAPLLDGADVVAREYRPFELSRFWARLRSEAHFILTSPGLIVLALFGVAKTAAYLWSARSLYGTVDHPTVAATVTAVHDNFLVVVLMIASFYGGELVWRERDCRMDQMVDSTPTPSWVITIPKILAVFIVLLILDFFGMVTAIVYELVSGAPRLGLAELLRWFVLPASIDGLLIATMAVFLHILSPNKYVGWGLLFLWFAGSLFLHVSGYSNPLYSYGATPDVPLSDFVGAGNFWWGAAVFRFYWFCFACLLAVIAHWLWPRGRDASLRIRLRTVSKRLSISSLTVAGLAIIAMGATGAYAYHNIAVLNRYETKEDINRHLAAIERKYLRYEKLPQPTIANVSLDIQLWPRKRELVAVGSYELLNRSGRPLSEIHIRQRNPDAEFLSVAVSGARLVMDDAALGYRIYKFEKPFAPGGRAVMTFKSRISYRGFRAFDPATDIVENGTFIDAAAFIPVIGMDRRGLLTDPAERRKNHLVAELRPALLEDLSATARSSIASDWVRADIRISTDADQIPLAPGRISAEYSIGGRRMVRFVSEAPILNSFAIQSGRYRVASIVHNDVRLSVYYYPEHDWNVSKMLRAMGASLDYYRAHFGPYQFGDARIVEFPAYRSFAQAFAGTMPYSESFGFNANTDDPRKIDFTTYVVAHEMAHQYWAHQVVGADVQGATFLSETLAQYSALMVMKRLYGPDKIRRFLKYELDNYLRGRQGDVLEEQPLERVENQQYVHYRKGAVVMYLLQEQLGEAAVNRALSRFASRYRFKGSPYPRSVDLISEIRKEAQLPAQQQLITDLFEKITLYDLKVKDAETHQDSGGWATIVQVEAHKAYADGNGRESAARMLEPIEVGLFTAQPGLSVFAPNDVILLRRVRLSDGVQKIVLRSTRKPTFAGVDPYNFRIDRNSDDNIKNVLMAASR